MTNLADILRKIEEGDNELKMILMAYLNSTYIKEIQALLEKKALDGEQPFKDNCIWLSASSEININENEEYFIYFDKTIEGKHRLGLKRLTPIVSEGGCSTAYTKEWGCHFLLNIAEDEIVGLDLEVRQKSPSLEGKTFVKVMNRGDRVVHLKEEMIIKEAENIYKLGFFNPLKTRLSQKLDLQGKPIYLLAMEKKPGRSLSYLYGCMNKGGFENTYEIIKNIAIELNRLHNQGKVHRDIKPSNLMYNHLDLTVNIVDFSFIEDIDAPASSGDPFFQPLEDLRIYRQEGKEVLSYVKIDSWAFGLTCLYLYGIDIIELIIDILQASQMYLRPLDDSHIDLGEVGRLYFSLIVNDYEQLKDCLQQSFNTILFYLGGQLMGFQKEILNTIFRLLGPKKEERLTIGEFLEELNRLETKYSKPAQEEVNISSDESEEWDPFARFDSFKSGSNGSLFSGSESESESNESDYQSEDSDSLGMGMR